MRSFWGGANSNSTDPLVTRLSVLKDGKIGTLPVNSNNFKITEHVTGNVEKSML